jgi:hypothetical protein
MHDRSICKKGKKIKSKASDHTKKKGNKLTKECLQSRNNNHNNEDQKLPKNIISLTKYAQLELITSVD